MLTLIEKVLFLQEIDVFQNTTTEDLSYIAAITEEIVYEKNRDIFKEGDASDALYLIVEGKVQLHRSGQSVMIAKEKDVFGTWALFDDEPRVVTATTLEDCVLLCIGKEEFYDLLSDHPQITQDVLKTLTMRLRRLIQSVNIGSQPDN